MKSTNCHKRLFFSTFSIKNRDVIYGHKIETKDKIVIIHCKNTLTCVYSIYIESREPTKPPECSKHMFATETYLHNRSVSSVSSSRIVLFKQQSNQSLGCATLVTPVSYIPVTYSFFICVHSVFQLLLLHTQLSKWARM